MTATRPTLRPALRAATALLLLAAAMLGLGTSAANAASFGYGDGRPDMFSDARWLSLGLHDARRLVEWDTPSDPAKTAALDEWMNAAHSAGVRPLVAIDRSWTPGRERSHPSIAQYQNLIRWIRGRYPYVDRLTPWNEANFRDQPTAKNPRLAWQYYATAKATCSGCIVTSPVILVGKSVSKSWIAKFKKIARGRIKLWAVHNYGDANRGENTGLRWFEQQVKGQIWITEAAGWVQFLGGRYFYNEQRAANAITRVIRTAKADHRIGFVYFYQWRGTDDRSARWDSGVVNQDGSPRKGYYALKSGLGR